MERSPRPRRASARAAVVRIPAPSSAERLERRLLFASHATTAAAALAARGPLAKIGTDLAIAAAAGSGTVAVNAYAAPGRGANLVKAERRLGATNVVRHGRSVYSQIPAASLAALAQLKSLRFARPDDSVLHAGAVTSQGDVSDRAANARTTYSTTGSGVTVGILSDSFNVAGGSVTYTTDISTGDLPAGVQILAEGPATGTDEGRAMAQVIYDSAPGAKLVFATATSSQATMAANIAALVKAGAKVIVDDVSFLAEPMFQDGPIAQAVAAAVAKGVSYFTAAGETGSRGYASTWRSANTLAAGAIPSANGAPAFYGGTFFNFAADGTTNPYNSFTLAAGASITLSFQWDSPYYSVSGGSGSANQVDAYVLNAAGTQVVGGGVNLDIGGDPVQVFTYTNNTGASANFNLALVSESGTPLPGYLKYVDFTGAATNWSFGFNSGTVYGHANATPAGAGLESVGAAYYAQTPAFGTSPAIVEATSATGTTPILFDAAGNRLGTAVVRQAPGIVAPDGVDTTFFGRQTNDGNNYPNFFGTSAAAASAAGVAALMLSRVSALSPVSLDAALQSTALDMGAPGVDTQTGYGLIQADGAIAAALNSTTGTVTGAVYQDNNGSATFDTGDAAYTAGATVFVDANRNGTLDAGEVSTTTATDGTFALTGAPVGSDLVRIVVPNGTVATAGSTTVSVAAGATVGGLTLGLFPFVFSGTAGNDSYTLQLNPTNNKKVDILLGSVSYSVQLSLLTTLLFNPGAGDDTLNVSFLNGSPMPSGGLTYDGGTGTNTLIVNGSTGTDAMSVKAQQTNVNNQPGIQAVNIAAEIINGNGGNDGLTESTAVATGQTLTFNAGAGGSTTFAVGAPLPNNGAGYVYNANTAPGSSGKLNVVIGTYALPGDPSLTSANLSVNVSANATLLLPAAAAGTGVNTRTFADVAVASGGTMTVAAPPTRADRALIVARSVSVAGTGKLDLTGNDMVVTSGTLASVASLAGIGYNAGAWNGSGGIVSATAAADTNHRTAVGVIANTPNGATGPLYSSTNLFDGVYAPAATAILVRYTYYGDANLDGTINVADYTRIDAGYITPNATGWVNGDFNYDALIDGSDYTLMDNAFNFQSTSVV